MQKTAETTSQPFAPLWRRLLAMLYDGLLLIAVLMLATVPMVVIFDGVPGGWRRHIYQIYLFSISFLFYTWFWVHGGQTLGMRSWRLRLVSADLAPVGWQQAAGRFFSALLSDLALGAGYLWVLFDPLNRAWHDRLSSSYIILLPKKSVQPK